MKLVKEGAVYTIDKTYKLKNTNKFREAAIYYQLHGKYTEAREGSQEYLDYWTEEQHRCLYGYSVGEDYITGYNYFYLNYCPIFRPKNKEVPDGKGGIKIIRDRGRDFPDFYDYDKLYFDALDAAEMDRKHLAVLKARGKGYSFKAASMLCRNYFFIEGSSSFALASEQNYLIKDGLLTKAWEIMDFVDKNTGWYKKRQVVNQKLHRRSSYIVTREGVASEHGWLSEIFGISFKNDEDKPRGIRGKLGVIEEGGKAPKVDQVWQIIRPSFEEDGSAFGIIVIQATGGEEGADFEGMKDIFSEPDAYNCIKFENIWDDGKLEPCGLFIPEYANMKDPEDPYKYMDEDGNTKEAEALEFCKRERDKIEKNASNRNAIDRYIAEHPFNPQEACLNVSVNVFPKADLIRHLSYIKTHQKVENFKQVGDLLFDESGIVRWYQALHPRDLIKYKLIRGEDTRGQIVIWEHPIQDPTWGMYIGGCDPYDHDKSGTNSLGSIFIYKRFISFGQTYEFPVAEYSGRPDSAEEYYENVRKLLLYYKAQLLYENERKGLFTYFANKHCEYLLADQPILIKDIIKNSSVHRGKGIHMVQAIKDHGERLLRDWMNVEYSPGQKNLSKIYSIPLLEELIAYDDKGNFDRVIAMIMVMLYAQELVTYKVKERVEPSSKKLFKDRLFESSGTEEDAQINRRRMFDIF